MFTGIVESLGKVVAIQKHDENITLSVECGFLNEIKIDQSIAHNGVCLTVDGLFDKHYTVTAIKETLEKTNLGKLEVNSFVNLERCMKLGDRLDGHIVQGHVDTTAIVEKIIENNGSWEFYFKYEDVSFMTVSKGSICVNGVSLTVVQSDKNTFSVAIIPYTFENTSFKFLKQGNQVNLEFDILGKYITKLYYQNTNK